MTTSDYRPATDLASNGRSDIDDGRSTTDQAKEAASTAADQGKHLAGTAKSEAADVAADVKEQGAQLFHQARQEVEQQSRTQLDSLVGVLQGFADDLEKMTRGDGAGSGLARDVVQEVGDKAKALSSQLRDREPGELLDQARHYARRKPGTFLLGALAAGVVAGRLARGAKEASGASGSSSSATGLSGSAPQAGTAAGDPLSGTTAPPSPPAAYPEGTSTSTTSWGTP